jgi:hypothetical protein
MQKTWNPKCHSSKGTKRDDAATRGQLRLKNWNRNQLGSLFTLKVGSGDGASIRGLFAAAGGSETLFLVAAGGGEQSSWKG